MSVHGVFGCQRFWTFECTWARAYQIPNTMFDTSFFDLWFAGSCDVFSHWHTHIHSLKNRINMLRNLPGKPYRYIEATAVAAAAAIQKYIVHSTHAHREASNLFIYYFIMLKWLQVQISKQSKQNRADQSNRAAHTASKWECNCLFIYLFIHRVSWAHVCCNCRFGK